MSDLDTTSTTPPLQSPPPPAPRQMPKSPPLAFEKTSNDSLAPLPALDIDREGIPGLQSFTMGSLRSASLGSPSLQTVVEKQAKALHQLHLAFAAEREAWTCERESMQLRISSLERLLSVNNGHSPAKSPTLSPTGNAGVSSPPSRLTISQRLPMIAEDENSQPFSQRRRVAPPSIDVPQSPQPGEGRLRYNSVVAFSDSGSLMVEEIPTSPRSQDISPVPASHRVLAGHTPLKRPPTPPPKELLALGLDDTPTRNNTHINAFLTQSRDEEQEMELKGPLNMPELPNKPGQHNFTEEALRRRLEQISMAPPGAEVSKPMIFHQPTPGTATPEDSSGSRCSRAAESRTEKPPAPGPTRDSNTSNISSALLSPQSGLPLPHPRQMSHDEEIEQETHRKFDQGGIKLRKKPSSNFGAPFGSLGGLGGIRRPS